VFLPVMELFCGSLESKASSPCQLSKPSSSPAWRHIQLLLRTHGRKRCRYTYQSNGFMVIGHQFKVVSLGIWISLFIWMAILRLR